MRLAVALAMFGVVSSAHGDKPDPRARVAADEMSRAQRCLDRRDYGCAVEHFDKARTFSPQSSGPWLGLGVSYAAQGRCGEAVPVLDEYLRRKPTGSNPNAIAARARCQEQLDAEARRQKTPEVAPIIEPPPPTVSAPAPATPTVIEEVPEPIFTAPQPKSMARWKIGLIASGTVLAVGLVVAGITVGVLSSRGELHGETTFTPVVLP
jgi:hypothetical protein